MSSAPAASPDRIPGPRGYPLLGVLPDLLKRPLDFCSEAAADHGGLVRLSVGRAAAYLVVEPDFVQHILIDNHTNYWKGGVNHRARFFFGDSLVSVDGEFWKKQRKLVQPAFHRQVLTKIADRITDRTVELVDHWKSQGARPINVAHDLERLTMEIIIRAIFKEGVRDEEVERMGDTVMLTLRHAQLRFLTYFLPNSFPLPGWRRTRRALKTFDDTIYRLIDERRRTNEPQDDMLEVMAEVRDAETGETMSDRQLRDEIALLISAGGEAPGMGLGWCLYLLAQSPEIEERLHAEVDAVLEGRQVTFADLPRLVYLRKVFSESMRIYPPVWMFFRQSYEPDRLGDHVLPAGAYVLLSPYVTHRSSAYWPEPLRFDPERFDSERSADRHSFSYFPYGGGQRMCLGSGFANMEAHLMLATIAQQVRLRRQPDHRPVPMVAGGLRSRNGILMTVEPR